MIVDAHFLALGRAADANLAAGQRKYQKLTVSQTGVAWSPLHGAVEIGVNLSRHLGVALLGRFQGTLTNNADSSDDEVSTITLMSGASARSRLMAPAQSSRARTWSSTTMSG